MAKKWEELTDKEKKSGITGIIFLVLISFFIASNSCKKEEKKKEKPIVLESLSVESIKWATSDERLKIVAKYLQQENIPNEQLDVFDTYFSHMAAITPGDRGALSILTMAKSKYLREGKLEGNYWKLTDLMYGKFHGWDGSFIPLETYLKNNINDASSYEHVETRFEVRTLGKKPWLVVATKFRANNGYGAKVLAVATAKYDLLEGKLYEVQIAD
ncbi:hypothetical protein [Halodesulfovibrio aestuarii]|uniref:hypothetical protein n=1 Tax=Halodesulfovibrio aestuarii TaxID=126333 RepID=UPI003D3308FB